MRGWYFNEYVNWGIITAHTGCLNCMEGGAVMQVLREVGDIGNDQFAKTVLSQWPYPSKTLYLDIKSYLEMETKKLPIGHTEEAEIIKQRMIVVYKAATELLDKELRQDLQLWAEAVFPFLKKMGKLTSY